MAFLLVPSTPATEVLKAHVAYSGVAFDLVLLKRHYDDPTAWERHVATDGASAAGSEIGRVWVPGEVLSYG